MNDIKKRMEKAKQEAREYGQITGEEDEKANHEMFDIADLIVENKLMIDKIDALIGKQESTESSEDCSRNEDELSELS